MRRKAIERLAPKRPAGKGLTATLQELEKILILNIYQAKDLLVRYCINYETGEHEYWIEQHGWRKGGILNALNEDWRDWEWRPYENYPKLQKKDADRIRELIRERVRHDSPWERINGLEHRYNREIRENTEMNKKARLMDIMRKVPDRPGDLREWFLRSQQERTICSVKKEHRRLPVQIVERAAKRQESRGRMVEKRSGIMTWCAVLPVES